jgi:hypothetical protein
MGNSIRPLSRRSTLQQQLFTVSRDMRLKTLGVLLLAWAAPVAADGAAGLAGNQANVAVSTERGVRVWRPLDTDGGDGAPAYGTVVPPPAETTVYQGSYGAGIYVPGYGIGYVRRFGHHHVNPHHRQDRHAPVGVNIFRPASVTIHSPHVAIIRRWHGQTGAIHRTAGPVRGYGSAMRLHGGSHRAGHGHR